eukprot:gene10841-14212_t
MCVATLLIVAIVDAIAFHPDGIQAPDASANPVPTNGGGSSSSKASRIEEFVGKNNNNKTNNNNNSTFGSTREIFVAGCGHSGTTVMLRLIGQLSAIFPVQEETCVLCTTGDLSRISAEHRAMHPWERSARRLAELDAAAAGAGARRWVEKTPIHVRYLEKLFLLRWCWQCNTTEVQGESAQEGRARIRTRRRKSMQMKQDRSFHYNVRRHWSDVQPAHTLNVVVRVVAATGWSIPA